MDEADNSKNANVLLLILAIRGALINYIILSTYYVFLLWIFSSLYLFGRDVSKIPCFRSSFLYGMGGGFGIGLMSFMFTSKPRLSTHVGFSGFVVTTLSYWMYCRYRWSLDKFAVSQLQPAMKNKALFEGTKFDPEIKEA